MPTTFNAGSNTYWFFTNLQGKPLAGGKIYSYRDTVRSQSKPIYQNAAGTAYPNPVTLNDNGMTPGPLYFADDENYYLVVTGPSGLSSGILYIFEGYQPPDGGGSSPVTVNQDFRDFIGDATYMYVPSTNITPLAESQRIGQAGWYFTKNNTSATDEVEFLEFNPGDSTPPLTPKRYMRYSCSVAGTGETFKGPGYRVQGARNLEQTQVSIAMYAKSSTAANTVEIVIKQNFGTGGTPSTDVETSVTTHTLTNSWAQYFTSLVIPSVSGKTFGTNNDSYVSVEFRLPLNALTEIDITMAQLNLGNSLQPFDYLTPTINASNIIPPFDPINKKGYALVSNFNSGFLEWIPSADVGFFTGFVVPTFLVSAPAGWVLMDDGSIGNAASSATTRANADTIDLFTLLWDNVADADCPVSGGRGANAAADFAANKTIGLPKALGRALAGAGTGSGLTARTLGNSLGIETMTEAEMPAHAHAVDYRVLGTQGGGTFSGEYIRPTGTSATTYDTRDTGDPTPSDNVMQPTTFVNYLIKL